LTDIGLFFGSSQTLDLILWFYFRIFG